MSTLNDIRAAVVRHGIGRVELAEMAGVSPQTIQRLLDEDDANPTLETLGKVCAGIDRVIARREEQVKAIAAGHGAKS